MKLEELRKEIINRYLTLWTEKGKTYFSDIDEPKWIINEDYSVDVDGSIYIDLKDGDRIPFKFRTVHGIMKTDGEWKSYKNLENLPDVMLTENNTNKWKLELYYEDGRKSFKYEKVEIEKS